MVYESASARIQPRPPARAEPTQRFTRNAYPARPRARSRRPLLSPESGCRVRRIAAVVLWHPQQWFRRHPAAPPRLVAPARARVVSSASSEIRADAGSGLPGPAVVPLRLSPPKQRHGPNLDGGVSVAIRVPPDSTAHMPGYLVVDLDLDVQRFDGLPKWFDGADLDLARVAAEPNAEKRPGVAPIVLD